MIHYIADLLTRIQDGYEISRDDAAVLTGKVDIHDLLYGANRLRQYFCGNTITCCAIINAKSGRCGEDCAYCAQSVHHSSAVQTYPLVDEEMFVQAYRSAYESGAQGVGIVTSGGCLDKNDLRKICGMIGKMRGKDGAYLCASLGMISEDDARALKEAGLKRFHHNLETSRRFFPRICTTHSYDERVETVKAVKRAGLEVCSGGLFGLGEEWRDRIDLAFTLRELDVDSVPLNFLHPIKGTPLEAAAPLSPMAILRIIALYRFVLPGKDIRVCGGREYNLRDTQSWVFYAGASSVMIGNYLTTAGRSTEVDRQMIVDLGLVPAREHPERIRA